MIKILAKELYKAVKEVKRTNYSTLPVLNHARIGIVDGWLTITTTNLETTKTARASCIWDEDITTCVPMVNKVSDLYPNGRVKSTHKYYPFLDWLKVMAEYDELLTITHDKKTEKLMIKSSISRTEFKCIDAQEFPRS